MYDEAKVDDMVLALLHLVTFKDRGDDCAWKGLTGTPSTAFTSAG